MRSLAYSAAVLILLSAGIPAAASANVTRGFTREATPYDAPPGDGSLTGIIYDRVLPLSRIEDHSGSETDPPIGLRHWHQVYFEIGRASLGEPAWPEIREVRDRAEAQARGGIIPIAFMNFTYDRTAADHDGPPRHRVFAVSALRDYTYQGSDVVFGIDPGWYFTNDSSVPGSISIDFDDMQGFREVGMSQECRVAYGSPGRKTIRARMHFDDGMTFLGSFYFDVRQLQTPMPHDTLSVTATIPYLGEYGSGSAYIYLSDQNTSLTNPVVVIEGFDIDNTMGWEVLYETMNQEGMVESLRTRGFDAVVLDFTDATDYIQRNSFVAVELIEEINALIAPGQTSAVVGASMGGLIGRYALAYMEMNALDHNVRTLISFDAPQKGANIPLGIQYWILFFAPQSADAEVMLQQLQTPAPRQMLVYYFTDPPGSTGESDSLLVQLQSDFAAVGGYPANVRKVAIANGSGHGADQGFAPGDQIILYEYNSLLVDVVGNVWAVPDGANHIIFDGLLDLIWPLPDDEMTVYVAGTLPYDSAPGGTRGSMAQMDSTEAPYGDIIALHDNHCFIPTISALDLDTEDLFYDIANDPDLLTHTPFDTVYFTVENQEHVAITAESRDWFLAEIQRGSLAGVVEPGDLPGPVLSGIDPNPFSTAATIRFSVPGNQHVQIDVFDVTGRRVRSLLDGPVAAGRGAVTWNGEDRRGNPAAPGIYFCRMVTMEASLTTRMVLLK